MRYEEVDSASFRSVLGHYPTGVCVIAALNPGGDPIGLTVGSFTSVSLTPPLVGFFPDRRSTTWPRVELVKRFSINVLNESQRDISAQFATKIENKFAGVPWRRSPRGSPILEGSVASLDCELFERYDAGDHFGVLALVVGWEASDAGAPLIFCRGEYGTYVNARPKPLFQFDQEEFL